MPYHIEHLGRFIRGPYDTEAQADSIIEGWREYGDKRAYSVREHMGYIDESMGWPASRPRPSLLRTVWIPLLIETIVIGGLVFLIYYT